jgi:hypothetical protein
VRHKVARSVEQYTQRAGSLALLGQGPPDAALGSLSVFEEVRPPAVAFFAIGLVVQSDVRLRPISHGLHDASRESLHRSQEP